MGTAVPCTIASQQRVVGGLSMFASYILLYLLLLVDHSKT
jgi:hypothetical protein